MRKFITTYDKHSRINELIENGMYLDAVEDLNTFIDLLAEGKGQNFFMWGWDQIKEKGIQAAKVRELQQKANDLKFEAAREFDEMLTALEAKMQKSGTKGIDYDRLNSIFQKNVKLLLDNAAIYEEQVDRLTVGSDYLTKIATVLRYQGDVEANEILKEYASRELELEIDSAKEDMLQDIKIYMTDIRDMMKTRMGTVQQQQGAVPGENEPKGKMNFVHRATSRADGKNFTKEVLDEYLKGTDVFLKHALRKAFNRMHGRPENRRSSNAEYAMLDDAVKLMKANPTMSEFDALMIAYDDHVARNLLKKPKPGKK